MGLEEDLSSVTRYRAEIREKLEIMENANSDREFYQASVTMRTLQGLIASYKKSNGGRIPDSWEDSYLR
jgi:hypothetical protein